MKQYKIIECKKVVVPSLIGIAPLIDIQYYVYKKYFLFWIFRKKFYSISYAKEYIKLCKEIKHKCITIYKE